MFKVKVPATTANMGPGFDSIGMALQLYNEIEFEEIESGFEINALNDNNQLIPTDERNLIYKTFKNFFDDADIKLPGIKITQNDSIPLTRGLGSSAACIVAGLIAADKIAGTNLEKKELAEIAAVLEGHPDNSTPAILGGMVSGVIDNEKLSYVKFDVSDKLDFNVMIPNFTLSTEKARKAVPQSVSLKDAVFNVSRAALLVSSMITGNFDNLKTAVDDRLHQPYRMPMIPDMDKIFEKSYDFGAKAAFLSGAGPTLIAVTHDNSSFKNNMSDYLSLLENSWTIINLKPDINGACIYNN